MIITIDGPAGSGKSSTAKEVARRLGYPYLDSGAFYRALTWAALEAGIDPARWPALSEAELDRLGVSGVAAGGAFHMIAGDRDISGLIRSAAVNAHVSAMAALPAVRGWLLGRLRSAASAGDLVTDGRDMGTVVFPDAELKIYLVAHPGVRAARRLLEQGLPTDPDEVSREMDRLTLRDQADMSRETAPLRLPEGATEIDTSDLSFEEQVDAIVRLARIRAA
jgi:cytidylate kinase